MLGCAVAQDVFFNFFFQGSHAAYARSPDDPDAVFVKRFHIEPGVLNGFIDSYHGHLGEAVEPTGFAAVHVVFGIEAFELAGELRFEKGSVKKRDQIGTTKSVLQTYAKSVKGIANGGEGTKASHNNSFHTSLRLKHKTRRYRPAEIALQIYTIPLLCTDVLQQASINKEKHEPSVRNGMTHVEHHLWSMYGNMLRFKRWFGTRGRQQPDRQS